MRDPNFIFGVLAVLFCLGIAAFDYQTESPIMMSLMIVGALVNTFALGLRVGARK